MTAMRDEVVFIGWEREVSSTSPARIEAMRPKHRLDGINRGQLNTYEVPASRLIASLMGDRSRAEDALLEIFAKAYWAEKCKALPRLLGIYPLAIFECLRRLNQSPFAVETIGAPTRGSRARILQLLFAPRSGRADSPCLAGHHGTLAELSGFFDRVKKKFGRD